MSVLCEVRKEERIGDGELYKPGDVVLLPDSLALALEKKGFVAWANPEAQLAHAKAKRERRDARELAEMEAAEAKGKKGKRAHG